MPLVLFGHRHARGELAGETGVRDVTVGVQPFVCVHHVDGVALVFVTRAERGNRRQTVGERLVVILS